MIQRLLVVLKRYSNRRIRIFFLSLLLIFFAVVFSCNIWIIQSTKKFIYTDVDAVPEKKVGLLLGTSKLNRTGHANLFFNYRIEAAVALFRAKKIQHILVSGDNSIKEYDEANDMRDALLAMGIPDSCITLDFAGFRTLDSVVRCLKIFGQSDVTIISQAFHNERALFIARYYNMDAVAFSTKEIPSRYSIKTSIREFFAKFKAVLDLYVLHKQPKFLGKKEIISV